MKNLVRKTMVRIMCDTYTCNNLAEYEVGHEVNRAFCSHFCEDCMKSIAEEAGKMFGDMKTSVKDPVASEPETVETVEKEKEKEESVPEKEVEYYICKYCGEKFVKPTQLSEYKSHVMKCQRL